MMLRIKRWLAPLLRVISPSYGACKACGVPWKFAKPHDTDYQDGSGVFALCEDCWQERTPEQRLPYYGRLVLVDWWRSGSLVDYTTWANIKAAVLSGK